MFILGAGWGRGLVEAVEPERVLIRGRRAGSSSETSFAVFDQRNILQRRLGREVG